MVISGGGHCQNGDSQWLPPPITIPVMNFFPATHLHTYTNKKNLGQPPPEWRLVVAFGGTQVLNSNSTLGVQDLRCTANKLSL